MTHAIMCENLTKHYGKTDHGITDLCLMVEKGSFYGFMGPNGAGKSTTIRTLMGLIMPTSGKASVLGYDIVNEKKDILKRTGYLPSEAGYYPAMRVGDLLKFASDARGVRCDQRRSEIMERLCLDPSGKIGELSFGNRKKVGITAALQHDPELLILDEPTGGLDPLMQKEFFSILKEMNGKGVTVFLSSHVLSEIQDHCDRAAIIRDGRLVAEDSVRNLTHTRARRVKLICKGHEIFSACDGYEKTYDGCTFLWNGETDELIRKLVNLKVKDFTVSEPTLEEIFMHYYREA